MDERSWAEKSETGQNALAHLGSAPEQNCTGALGKCASTILALAHLPSAPRPERPIGQALAGLVRVWSNSEAWLSH